MFGRTFNCTTCDWFHQSEWSHTDSGQSLFCTACKTHLILTLMCPSRHCGVQRAAQRDVWPSFSSTANLVRNATTGSCRTTTAHCTDRLQCNIRQVAMRCAEMLDMKSTIQQTTGCNRLAKIALSNRDTRQARTVQSGFKELPIATG